MSDPLVIDRVEIASLTYDERNVRLHSTRNIDAIKQSLKTFGQRKPIVVLESGRVIAGNGTLQVAVELGWTQIDCVFSNMSDDEATAYAIADNRTAELATWDSVELPLLLRELNETLDPEFMNSLGFRDDELKRMLKNVEETSDVQLGGVIYRVVVDVTDAEQQAILITELQEKGYTCQPLMS